MKKHSTSFRLIILIASILFVLTAVFFIYYTSNRTSSTGGQYTPLLLSALVYFILVNIISGSRAGEFNTQFRSMQNQGEGYRKKLDAFGRVPLGTLVKFILLSIVWCISLIFTCRTLNIPNIVMQPLVVLLIAFGMLAAAFIYIIGDNTVSVSLLSGSLKHYPLNLKYLRQKNKNFIIPFFIGIMTLIYTSSIQRLQIQVNSLKQIDELGMSNTFVFGIYAIYLLTIGVLIFTWTRGNSKIYLSLMVQLEKLNESEKNLAGRIDISSVDELGFISGRINEFCEGLAENVNSLKDAQGKLSELGSELNMSALETTEAIEQISVSVTDVSTCMAVQTRSVQESSGAVEQIARNIESLENMISEQAASITEASASIEEMVSGINSITNSTNKMAASFAELLSASELGRLAQAASAERIVQITERSSALFEANQVIASIAAQTNLLAMNAAIEAAHAGDAGRGFSVVASEIRSLAETSGKQSKNIKQEISSVQKAIIELVAESEGSEKSYSKVAELITETGTLVKELELAMGEQKSGSMEILKALETMNSITQQVQGGSKEMSSGNDMVLSQIRILNENNQAIEESMSRMHKARENIGRTSKRFSELADGTASTIRQMDESLGSFHT